MAAASSSSSSSSSATMDGFAYDVFLSFRGIDTRHVFTGHLWKALEDRGIRTFFDKEDIGKGEEISPSLLKAIEQSRMAIVVLSPNYAFSSFCLDEVSHILACIQGKGRLVWPVFYDVDPSDVRWLKGTYGEAMAKHEANISRYNADTLRKWKKALQQVANLSGTYFKNGGEYQYEFIEHIVIEVSRQIKPFTLYVADYLVGVEPQKQDVISLLNVGSDDKVHMVGIHGIGGIGKTTLAIVIYNSIAIEFKGSCFLEKVRENSVQHGLTYLQKILLSKAVGEKEIELINVHEGIQIIQQRLRKKKILLILDDVDDMEQLRAIAGRPEWFGPGSRVIITTRDKGLLTRHGVESTYEVKGLNKKDALELLRWSAFKTHSVSSSYADVLNRAITYASGFPLALKVIGSQLFKKGTEEWESTLDRYERIPNNDIQKVLKVSFDALNKEEKSVFLDIARHFKGRKLAMVEKLLHAHHGDSKKDHISVLAEKSLIQISESGDVTLHDLIEDMGKKIVEQESPKEPKKRSMLWHPKDIVQVLEENTIFENMTILNLDHKEFLTKIPNVSGLPNLEEISFQGCINLITIDDSIEMLGKLKILCAKNCQKLRSFPSLNLASLEEMDISYCGSLKTFPPVVDGLLGKLKILRADNCKKLTSFPPLKLASLEELYLSHCHSLESFPPVVDGFLGKLRILYFDNCWKLRSFPPLMLATLEELYLSHCHSLESFPPVVDGLLGKLRILYSDYCKKLRSFPPLKLASLEELYLSHCHSLTSFPPVVDGLLGKLRILYSDNCWELKSFPPLMLATLEELYLSHCHSLESFPPVVDGLLGKLRILYSDYCKKLRSFPPLKLASLEELYLSHCHSLTSFPPVVDGLLGKLRILYSDNCWELRSFPPLMLATLEELYLSHCHNLESFPPVVDGFLGKLRILYSDNCWELRSFPPLMLAALEELYLSNCHSLESFPPVVDGLLGKLRILYSDYCKKLRSFPPLMLASLEELYLSHCRSLESFPPVVDGLLGKLRILYSDNCWKLRSFPPLMLATLEELYLSNCHSLESFPPVVDGLFGKLRILYSDNCWKLRSVPPLNLPLLEQLNFSHCDNLESFPEILGEMANVTQLQLEKTPIKEFPFSFRNLTRLRRLYLSRCGIVRLPSSIVVMSEMAELTIEDGGWLLPKQDEGEEKVSPMQSSQVELLHLRNCNLSDESLAIGLKWFANVKELDLSGSKFTTLPECIENCRFLWKLIVKDCEELHEIKGIPPSLNFLSAMNCNSLTLSSKSKLLNQELHETGNTWFCLPGEKIPEWVDHQCMEGQLISFWFRNRFPAIALCVVSPFIWLWDSGSPIRVIINGSTFLYMKGENSVEELKTYHLHIFHMQMEKFNGNLDKALLGNKWNQAEVDLGFPFKESGIHVLKEKSSMEDIRFTNPEDDVNIGLLL